MLAFNAVGTELPLQTLSLALVGFIFSFFFIVLLCLSVSVKALAVKTASEITYIVSGGALNSTHSLFNQFLS